MMTLKEIDTSEYKLHHMATQRGYISRRTDAGDFPAEPYKGRFGTGYKVLEPRFDSTQYCWVAYYVKEV